MARAILLAISFACLLGAQQPAPPEPVSPAPVYEEPPEEDETLATAREYTFNPLQAKKETDTGNFYFKRGNYRAAANRYREATLWDEYGPEPYFKMGEAYEKLEEYERAREAYTKFAALTADKGKAEDARKRMAKFPPAGELAPSGPAPGAPAPREPGRDPGQ